MADTERNWGAEPERAPKLAEGDVLMYCEHGRILYRRPEDRTNRQGTDCRSHWFRVVKNGGMFTLLVRHGGGEERVNLGYDYRNFPAILDPLDSDARYWLLWIILDVHQKAERDESARAARRYQQAFVEGRLRKRKQRGSDSVKVWIDPARAGATC